MLYLAEVQKKARVLGSSKVEFKLLACQRSEHSWSAVSEELITAPDDVPQNNGALVLVDLSASRQVQRYTDAGRQLVSILQNFSRLQDKFKTQEEEIEQWKQSLTYQSQELNRRELELETRQEQLQEVEEDFEKLEQQRKEIQDARAEVEQLQAEFQRKSQELEGAWAHLHGEQRRLEERKDEIQGAAGLSAEQTAHLQDIVTRLSGAIAPTDDVREQLNQAFDLISSQQAALDQRWQEIEQRRSENQHAQDSLDTQKQELHQQWQHWHEAQNTWIEAKTRLSQLQEVVSQKQEVLTALNQRLDQHRALKKAVAQAAENAGISTTGDKMDLQALESMPIDQLQAMVQELRQEWGKNSRFVNGQEEELTLQQQEIEKIKARIAEASEYDRLALENELSDEQESYRMLYETLVGQRRNLQEREMILRKHEAVLAKREGLPMPEGQGNDVDLEPVIAQITDLENRLIEEIQLTEQQIEQAKADVSNHEAQVSQMESDHHQRFNDLKQLDLDFQDLRSGIAEKWGDINTTDHLLKTLQESVTSFKGQLEAIANLVGKFQETSDYQLQSISEMQQVVQSLSSDSHQFATSQS
ncbi:MAG: pilus motility taxis protein HmpF [Leptolyngbyaceae bacterium]|nr:pilus motility taxis protein HmpF [Leptolyngbyaceae bacterium]